MIIEKNREIIELPTTCFRPLSNILVTLSKVHKLVNLILKNKKEKKVDMLDKKHPWNTGDEFLSQIVYMVIEGLDKDIEWLNAIKKQLPPLSKCKHPKELRDKCDGKIYCMGCNEEL